MIANCLTPYRVNLHRLVAAGIPELKLHTLITHSDAEFQWHMDLPEAIHVQQFGEAGDSPLAPTLRSPLREWRKGGRLCKYLHDHDVRAVICTGYRYISYLRTIRHCHRSGIPLFVRNDSNSRSEPQLSPLKQWLKSRTYVWWLKRVSGVMPMGEYGDEFFKKYGADPRRFYRVPYTPDYDAFKRVEAVELDRFRQKFGLSDARRYFLFSGRLVPVKRLDLLIDAFAAIAAERPEWDLLLVGDGILREELKRRVPSELCPRVVWTGFLEQREIVLAYHAAEVLVLPSDREPWAVVVQEAMAAGLVIVASDVVGAAREMVENDVSGRIFPAADCKALQRALLETSDVARLDEFKRQTVESLQRYRSRLDPVAEIRRALHGVNVLIR
jgi:glycosyltransferase involved in cell wall biosynthesis